jgi:hypothetical protein
VHASDGRLTATAAMFCTWPERGSPGRKPSLKCRWIRRSENSRDAGCSSTAATQAGNGRSAASASRARCAGSTTSRLSASLASATAVSGSRRLATKHTGSRKWRPIVGQLDLPGRHSRCFLRSSEIPRDIPRVPGERRRVSPSRVARRPHCRIAAVIAPKQPAHRDRVT